MSSAASDRRARARLAAWRARKRAQGLKLIRIWVPDPDSPAFAEAARAAGRSAREDPEFDEMMDFIERNAVAWEDDDIPEFDEPG